MAPLPLARRILSSPFQYLLTRIFGLYLTIPFIYLILTEYHTDLIKNFSMQKTTYYVVIRGIVPGIYTNMADTLINMCDVEGAYVRGYPSFDLAAAAWRQALIEELVTPLRTTQSLSGYSCIDVESGIDVEHMGDMSINSGDTDISTPDFSDDFKWRKASSNHGPKWVVWKGRTPGILDTW